MSAVGEWGAGRWVEDARFHKSKFPGRRKTKRGKVEITQVPVRKEATTKKKESRSGGHCRGGTTITMFEG